MLIKSSVQQNLLMQRSVQSAEAVDLVSVAISFNL